MPFCPACRYEYQPGLTSCPDCGAAMVDQLPEQEPELSAGADDDVTVARVDGLPIAEMLAELLGNKGIVCRIVPASSRVDGRAILEVRVTHDDAERARNLVPRAVGPQRRRPGQAYVVRPRRLRPRVEELREDRVLDNVDRAIQRGDVDLADRLLSSVDGSGAIDAGVDVLPGRSEASGRSWPRWVMAGTLAAAALVILIVWAVMGQRP